SNALRHTPHGGRVALAALPCDDGTVALTVTDTGTGIAPEHIAKIFDRFYRAEAGHIDAGQGTGLGLAIVKSIVEAHGGGVTLQSHSGEGTRVTLTFPSAAVCVPGKMTGLSS
ncbi:MAG TPA: sensor histidine kinase, partial [Gammaproteobacteria bacterium]|nr:sensor histidine kinase [Gammaproteobacteria bacterium]